jgi:8-oxo-dGTP pyrophosphatase MutT (NUDIX family)
MSLAIAFCDPNPVSPFSDRLDGDLANIRKLTVAVAYLTSDGAEYLTWKFNAGLDPSSCSLCVTIHHPTDLERLVTLHHRMNGRIFIYAPRASGGTGSKPKLPRLMHSKVVLAERDNGIKVAFVGSHNWTAPALWGENMEASVRIEGTAKEKFFQHVQDHLAACREGCERFDPARLEEYMRLQWELYTKEPPLRKPRAAGKARRRAAKPQVVIPGEMTRTKQLPQDLFGLEHPAWVNVVAVTADDRVVLVRQYRHGLGQVDFELPAGVVEADDASPEAAARRELLEETGYGGGVWRPLCVTSANPGTHNNLTHSFLAVGVQPAAPPAPDVTEDIRCMTVPVADVVRLVRDGEVVQALHLAPLLRYLLTRPAG